MYKRFLQISMFVVILFAISCTKDYRCECTTGTSSTNLGFYPDAKKKDAQEACDRVQASFGANTTTTCTIK